MKNIIVIAIALLVALLIASPMSARAGEAAASTAPQLTQTQAYRIWSAEQMIDRLIVRFGRANAACNNVQLKAFFPRISDACKEAVIGMYPRLKSMREVAASGDEVLWAQLIDVVHKLEADTDAPLTALEALK